MCNKCGRFDDLLAGAGRRSCPVCGTNPPDDAKSCPQCGAPLPPAATVPGMPLHETKASGSR